MINIEHVLLGALLAGSSVTAGSPPRWTAAWKDDTCSIESLAETSEAVLTVRRTVGDDLTILNIVDPAWKNSPVRNVARMRVRLEPGGMLGGVPSFFSRPMVEEPTLFFDVQGGPGLQQLASAKLLSILDGPKVIASFSLPPMEGPVAALRACEDQALRQWGIDPMAWHELRSRPVPRRPLVVLFDSSDYPIKPSAREGKIVVRLRVDSSGKPVECAPITTVDDDVFMHRSCAILHERARFIPATDHNGIPIDAPYVVRLAWRNAH